MTARTRRRAAAQSASAATTPPTASPWPPRYFVALCITRSTPCRAGFCSTGVAKVLSTSTGRVARRPARRRRGRPGPGSGSTASPARPGRCRARTASPTSSGGAERGLHVEQPGGEQVVGAAVQRADRDHVPAAGLGLGGQHHRGQRRHPRGVGHRLLGALQSAPGPPRTGPPWGSRAAGRRGRPRSGDRRSPSTRTTRRRSRCRAAGWSRRGRAGGRGRRGRGGRRGPRARPGSRGARVVSMALRMEEYASEGNLG